MNKKFYIGIIVLLVIVIIGMGIGMFIMNVRYQNQKNTLEQTEKNIILLKREINERCPGKFDFVD